MSDPTSYPTWRFWEDGRTTIVSTPEELAALPPGHAGSPAGPWEAAPALPPGVEETPPDHRTGQAPMPDQRERARALRDEGLSRRAIADALGVTEYTVRRLLEDP